MHCVFRKFVKHNQSVLNCNKSCLCNVTDNDNVDILLGNLPGELLVGLSWKTDLYQLDFN